MAIKKQKHGCYLIQCHIFVYQVKMCHLLEGAVLQTANSAGYAGVITNNTNPVTQVRTHNNQHYLIIGCHDIGHIEHLALLLF